MDPAAAKRLIVFGGSFDPPHKAHVELPRLVRQQLQADAVLYVPVGVPPHKPRGALTEARHRLAMLKLALADEDWAIIEPLELERAERGEPTYTVDTLETLHRLLPGAELRLLIGADQMRDFHTWKKGSRIIELAEPVVLARGDEPLPDESWRGRLLSTPMMDVSGTQIRQRLREGLAVDQWVSPRVGQYIRNHRLYSA